MLRWAGNPLLLLMLVLMLVRLVNGARWVHHSVLRRSTTGWSYHNLSLLSLLVGADCIVRDDDIADKLEEGSTGTECKALLKLSQQASHEAVLLLFICINLLCHIWCQLIEGLGVVIDGSSALPEVNELLALAAHNTRRDVLSPEGRSELGPLDMVDGVGGGVVDPPCLGSSQQLLCHKQSLLVLRATEKTKLELDHL
jgi:hypothetical protein